MILTLSGKWTNKDFGVVLVIIVGLLFFELLNITGKTAIDINDMIATIIFGAISAIVYFILLKKYGKRSLQNKNTSA